MLRIIAIALIATLYGCSGGSGNGSPVTNVTLTTPPPTSPVAGGGVKGPLANAVSAIFVLDPAAADLKGDQLGTGTTGPNAALVGLTVPNGTSGALLLEVVAGDNTIDITTGEAPIVTRLHSVIDAQDLARPIYVTPLTSLAVGLAQTNADSPTAPYSGNNDGSTDIAEYLAALNIAAAQVVSSFGFGLPADTNIFLTRPLLTTDDDTAEEQQAVLAYRQAIEAVSAVLDLVVQNAQSNNPNSTLTADQVLTAVAADLSDGTIDGNDANGAIGSLADVSDVAAIASTDVSLLQIPGTTTLVSDVRNIIANETGTTGATVSTTALENGEVVATLAPVRILTDADGDGVADKLDRFPNDPDETLDTDNDGTGNNSDTDDDGDNTPDVDDAFPLNKDEQLDTDGDTIGNNADLDDDGDNVPDTLDALPLISTETIDTDGDGTGDNADNDDDNDSVLDTLDAFPLNAAESLDTDGDGIGNNEDTDDDGDSVLDVDDILPLDKRSSSGTKVLITTEGGTITSADQRLSIQIPANALSEDTTLFIGTYDFAVQESLRTEFPTLDSSYVLEPSGLQFEVPATLTLQIAATGANSTRTQLPFNTLQNQSVPIPGVNYNPENRTVTVPINEYSEFALAWGTISVTAESTTARAGDDFEAFYTVKYFDGDPIGENKVFPEGLKDDGTFDVQPVVVGDDEIISGPFHAEAAVLPGPNNEVTMTGSVSGTCINIGNQSLTFNLDYVDRVLTSSAPTNGKHKVTINVACEPAFTEVTEPLFISVGQGIDRVNSAGPPPYNGISCTDQLYAVVSNDRTLLTTADGSCQASIAGSDSYLGTRLISDSGGDRLVTHSTTSTIICPLEEGAFCQLFRFFSQSATTDAKYARNADGSVNPKEVLTVSTGQIYKYTIDDTGNNTETTVLSPRRGVISIDSLNDKQIIGVTNGTPSEIYLFDLDLDTEEKIADVGDGALNVQCNVDIGSCAVASRDSEYFVTIRSNSEDAAASIEAADFELGVPVQEISTASLSVARTSDNRLAVAAGNDKTGRLQVFTEQPSTPGIFISVFSKELVTESPKRTSDGVAVPLTGAKALATQFVPVSTKFPNGGVMVSVDLPDDQDDGLVIFPFSEDDGFTPILDKNGED